MESLRWLKLAPLALLVAAGAAGAARPVSGADAGRSWDPPPCPAEDVGEPPGSAWYRLEPALDEAGTLAGMRLTAGLEGTAGRTLDLAPESFASGPTGGRILVGEDDGAVSRLSSLDMGRGCATAIAVEAAVIRSAVLAADGQALYEHRVDRRTRADLGVWRRDLGPGLGDGGAPRRVLAGLEPDASLGRTFFTDLVIAADGGLVASSCGARTCTVRALDPATGRVTRLAGTGPALGVTGRRLVVREACAGWPCAVLAVDVGSGRREVLVEEAWAAVLGGPRDGDVVYEAAGGRVVALEVETGRSTEPLAAGGIPLRRGSTSPGGAEPSGGTVVLAPDGRAAGVGLRAFDPERGVATDIGEVGR